MSLDDKLPGSENDCSCELSNANLGVCPPRRSTFAEFMQPALLAMQPLCYIVYHVKEFSV